MVSNAINHGAPCCVIHSNVFPFKTPPGWRREKRRGEENSESLGIKFPTTINTWSSNRPCLSLPRDNKCIKVRRNALKGNVFRWKENNQEWAIKANAGSIWRHSCLWEKAWVEQLCNTALLMLRFSKAGGLLWAREEERWIRKPFFFNRDLAFLL